MTFKGRNYPLQLLKALCISYNRTNCFRLAVTKTENIMKTVKNKTLYINRFCTFKI